MKYKLKALSLHIGGVTYKKPAEFDTSGKFKGLKAQLEAAERAGFLELVEEKPEEKKITKKKK